MGKIIEYKEGDVVGPHGCVFIHETDPYVYPNGKPKRRAMFKCPCGKLFDSVIYSIKSGGVQSCGCVLEYYVKHGQKTHGMTGDPLHVKWKNIKSRCFNANDTGYHNYGGRGVIMCDEWSNDFMAFYDYVTKLPHYGEPGRTLDRYPNNDGNYEPENVRWATRHEQASNRRMPSNNTTGYVGVSLSAKSGLWLSYITVNKVRVRLGLYNTPEEAVTARNDYIIKNRLAGYKIQQLKK